ncbi:MAG: formylglycine-generating enzyme family protein [Campylobacteraceae bacterium]|jgi:formylglycine-generating enzyme required for sulfatase activity|nr:formylglycine-generating enzyme family protein [Campylobacteraceae bacterium]
MNRYFFYLAVLALIFGGCSEKKQELSKTYTNGIGMKFVLINAGSFMMGSESEKREITLAESFYLGATEVTQEQWEKVMNSNPSKTKAAANPVDSVSWYDVKAFLSKLNALENTTNYRLPTEAEWEYAAAAASNDTYSFGSDEAELRKYAWYYNKNDNKKLLSAQAAGQKMPNQWGLYDMHGNVWEWVETVYNKDFYAKNKIDTIANTGNANIIKGGSAYNSAEFLRSSVRVLQPSSYKADNLGFRIAVTIKN